MIVRDNTMARKSISFIKRDGTKFMYSHRCVRGLIRLSSAYIKSELSEEEIVAVENVFGEKVRAMKKRELSYTEWRGCMFEALNDYPAVRDAFMSAHKAENAKIYEEICDGMSRVARDGDNSTGNLDSSLSSSQLALGIESLEKATYRHFHLNEEQKEALDKGYIYIHDMGYRRSSINCCLFDMATVLDGGFSMGEMWYDEPDNLQRAFDIIGNVTVNAAAQIYGGFTICRFDELLAKYAEKSWRQSVERYTSAGLPLEIIEDLAMKDVKDDMKRGFTSLEERFNSVISPRGDYPFITITFGLGRDRFSRMASLTALEVRQKGHGPEGKRRPVLFPKLVLLFDKNLHGKGGELYSLFKAALECSSKVMYPEYLSLTGEKGIVSEVYKEYGEVISPMCCRAFLSKWFERGGEQPADENDRPVFLGRFNIGVVSLNLPMILMKSKDEKTDFYTELDRYMEIARQIHIATYKYLSNMKASTNPLAFMQGGIYGGKLQRDDTIEPLLRSATASFGFTALNELQKLYNGKSLAEDGSYALEVIKYINKKVEEFKRADHIQYTVYGTPAETLCGRQVEQFNKMYLDKYGIIKGVNDRKYFSNSFHCHVSEEISPLKKQDLEARFWDYANGGKIQYVRFSEPRNLKALETTVIHAMDLGLYEGINISLGYCDDCGYNWISKVGKTVSECSHCHSKNMTLIERMCGYIAYTHIHDKSRLNQYKMAEIADRVSM